jgi:hypothetical protein
LTEAEKTAANPSYRGSFKIWQCPLDDVIRNINNRVTRSYTSNSYTILGSKRIFDYNSPRYIHELPDPSQTFTIVEQAKSYNTVGSGSNVIIKDDTNLMEATIGVMKSGNVQYDANHHNNGFKNPVINADGNGKIMYMPTTTADNNYIWSSKVY